MSQQRRSQETEGAPQGGLLQLKELTEKFASIEQGLFDVTSSLNALRSSASSATQLPQHPAKLSVVDLRKKYDHPTFSLNLPTDSEGRIDLLQLLACTKGSVTEHLQEFVGKLIVGDFSKNIGPTDERVLGHVVSYQATQQKVDAQQLSKLSANDYEGLKKLIKRTVTSGSELKQIQKCLGALRTQTFKKMINPKLKALVKEVYYPDCQNHEEIETRYQLLLGVEEKNADGHDSPAAFFTEVEVEDDQSTYTFPSPALTDFSQRLAAAFQLPDEQETLQLVAFAMIVIQQFKISTSRRVACKDEAFDPAIQHALDWDKILPQINRLMNDFACPKRYPTEDAGLLQYQAKTKYVPPAAPPAVDEAPKKSKKRKAIGSTSTSAALPL